MRVRRYLARAGDILRDVTIEMHARRTRAVLMIVAVALSTGALISAIGISTVAAHQVDADLAASTLSLISVHAASGTSGEAATTNHVFPDDADGRAESLRLVAAAGRRLDLTGSTTVVVTRSGLAGVDPADRLTVAGLTAGYVRAANAQGAVETAWMLDDDTTVAFLGHDAAKALSIPVTTDPAGYELLINGVSYSVAGFLDDGSTDLSSVIAIPYARALDTLGRDEGAELLVRAQQGAGAPVARVIRLAVRPDAPEQLTSSQVVDVSDLRTGVSTQLDRLAAWVGGLLLLLTLLLIANAMVVSVMARSSEIGLRRAMGATRASVAALFLTEGALSGALGGLAGSAVAAVAVVGVSWVNSWTAVVEPSLAVVGPAVGILAGLIASAYPALRAASIQPALAVRSD